MSVERVEIGPHVLYRGDCLEALSVIPDGTIQVCVTSPPYWRLRDYGVAGQIGQEPTPAAYVEKIVGVMRGVRRVLHDSGVAFLNVGDSYAGGKTGRADSFDGLKPKDLCLIPWRLAIALQDDGWYVRSVIVWSKKSCMPESVTDRPTNSWEPIILLAKSQRYFYDADAVREPNSEDMQARAAKGHTRGGNGKLDASRCDHDTLRGDDAKAITATGRNQRNVWHLGPEPFTEWSKSVRLDRVARDAVSYGMMRKASLDCPVHGYQDRQYDEHGDGENYRTIGNSSYHVLTRLPVQSTSLQNPVVLNQDDSLGYSSPTHSLFATDHNTQNHKTGHALETIQPYTPSVETPDRTEHSAMPLVSADSDGRIFENSNGLDDSGGLPSAETLSHNVRKSSWIVPPDCTCSFYHEVTGKTSHFATFPTEIPRRAILAGTSVKGCCPKCRTPWVRVVERGGETNRQRANRDGFSAKNPLNQGINCKGGHGDGSDRQTRTIGWRPGCTCNAGDPIPCLVIDPFSGSGTTVAVAAELGRHGIGIDLNADYQAMAVKRITDAMRQPALFEQAEIEPQINLAIQQRLLTM